MELNLSPNFNLDDIRKVRDYYYELSKTMSSEEFCAYLNEEAKPVLVEIERRRAAKKAKERRIHGTRS